MLGAPEAAQTLVTGPPCPAPSLAHPGTTAASSQTLLLNGLSLSQVVDPAVNRLGVVRLGRVVPAPAAPAQGRVESVYPRMMCHEKHQGGGWFCLSSPPQPCRGSMCKEFSSPCTLGLKGNPVPFMPDPDRARSSPLDHSLGCKFGSRSSWTRALKRDGEHEKWRGLLEHHEGGRTDGRGEREPAIRMLGLGTVCVCSAGRGARCRAHPPHWFASSDRQAAPSLPSRLPVWMRAMCAKCLCISRRVP